MSVKARRTRTRRVRRKMNAKLKYGPSAGPRHTRRGGRTGASMRKNGRSVRS